MRKRHKKRLYRQMVAGRPMTSLALSGDVDTHNIHPSLFIRIHEGELHRLIRLVMDYPDLETGGQLFGFWLDDGTPVVQYVLGPGKNANHSFAFFNQDIAYLCHVGEVLTRKYGLQHIGEWHSHHKLGLSEPSAHDAKTIFKGLKSETRKRMLLVIATIESGKVSLSGYNFAVDCADYKHAEWSAIPGAGCYRSVVDADRAIHSAICEENHQ